MMAIALVFLLSCAPPFCRVRVDVVFDGLPLPAPLLSSAMAEVTAIWAAYGVDIAVLPRGADGRDGAIRLTIVVAAQPNGHGLTQTLGAIRFVGGVPEPTIVMDTRAIDEIVSPEPLLEWRRAEAWSALHERVRGRVLGRAIAHEIGHYLLRSRDHSRTGLMRAVLQASDLIAYDRRAFALSQDDRTRLAELAPTWAR